MKIEKEKDRAGVYGEILNYKEYMAIGQYATVYQTKIVPRALER